VWAQRSGFSKHTHSKPLSTSAITVQGFPLEPVLHCESVRSLWLPGFVAKVREFTP
jgi:hypothetical protein